MATWGAHIRIAERLLNKIRDIDKVHFLVGNVGADCGVPDEHRTSYNPPRQITHWLDENKMVGYNIFYEANLKNKNHDKKTYSFMLGYYVHLISDYHWCEEIIRRIKEDDRYKDMKKDIESRNKIKSEWYEVDKMYFKRNPNSIFFKEFIKIDSFPDYMDYYPKSAIETQLKYISDYYYNAEIDLNKELIYMSENEMNKIVDDIEDKIMQELKEKKYV